MSGCPNLAQVTAADPQDPGQGGVIQIRYQGPAPRPDAPRINYPSAGNKL